MSLAKLFLAIGISLIFAVFVSYALYALYEPPVYPNCYKLTEKCQQLSDPASTKCFNEVQQSSEYQTCDQQFQQLSYQYARNSFYVLFILGIAAVITGIFLTSLEGIGSGLIGGGVLVIIWSLFYSSQYWFTLSKYVKIVALGIVLILLIYLGYIKIENKSKSKKK